MIRVAVAPVPVIVLTFVVLFLVRAIILVPFCQISSVCVVFAVIPVVVVTVARIVDSDLNVGFLRRCSCQDIPAGRKGSR